MTISGPKRGLSFPHDEIPHPGPVVTVTVSGAVGCGKSAIAGEIEIALKALGIAVEYADPVAAQSEKNMTHADWQSALELYRPRVVLVEQIKRQ